MSFITSLKKLREYVTNGHIIVFDCETTGLSSTDQVCQLAMIEYSNGQKIKTTSYYINPTCFMTSGAQDVHHLSEAFLNQHGVSPSIALNNFINSIHGNTLIVAHNARFLLGIFENSCNVNGVPFSMHNYQICDIIDLIKTSFKEGPVFDNRYRLGILLNMLQVEGNNTHDACDDVKASANLFFHLLSRTQTQSESFTKTSEFETSRATPNQKTSATESFAKSHIHSIENDSSDSDSWRRIHIHRRNPYNQPSPYNNQYNNKKDDFNEKAEAVVLNIIVLGVILIIVYCITIASQ